MSHTSTSNIRNPFRSSGAVNDTLDLLRSLADPQTHTTGSVNVRDLAERRGISRNTMRDHVKALEEEGLIDIERGHHPNFSCVVRG